MRSFVWLLIAMSLMACTSQPTIKRTHVSAFEKQIGYTQVVQYGDRLFLSGVAVSGPDMEQAVDQAYSIIQQVLQQHGSSMEYVVKELLFTTDMAAMKAQIATRKKYYPDGQYPASSWIEVKGLFLPELVLEVEVEAIIPTE